MGERLFFLFGHQRVFRMRINFHHTFAVRLFVFGVSVRKAVHRKDRSLFLETIANERPGLPPGRYRVAYRRSPLGYTSLALIPGETHFPKIRNLLPR